MMDQDTAQVLFHEGAILLFLDVPTETEFGIDYDSWQVGPNFRGVKMIPPGVHFVYFSANSKDGGSAPRTGFFHNFKPRELVVRKWDKETEDMTCEGVTDDDMERFAHNLKELDRYLGPYPYENYKKWISMTNHITDKVLKTLQPDNQRITSVTQFESLASTSQSRKRDKEEQEMQTEASHNSSSQEVSQYSSSQEICKSSSSQEEMNSSDGHENKFLPKMTEKSASRIHYSCITRLRYPSGASPAEVTRYSIDSSFLLEKILQEQYPGNDLGILGEIQFAFICFLIGQNYDSFEQWKKLVNLLCTSEEALTVHNDVFLQLVSVMHFQIQDIPEDFFVDIVSQNNFLTSTLQEFFSNLRENPVDERLRKRGEKFCEHLTQKFKWDFTSEPDDYAPVVVETD